MKLFTELLWVTYVQIKLEHFNLKGIIKSKRILLTSDTDAEDFDLVPKVIGHVDLV